MVIRQRTSKFTAAPATTFCPGDGDCVTMMLAEFGCPVVTCSELPAGCAVPAAILPVGAGIKLTLPTRMPESCKASVALPSGCPMKIGIT